MTIEKREVTPNYFVYVPPSPFNEMLPTEELAQQYWERGKKGLEKCGAIARWAGINIHNHVLNWDQHGYWGTFSGSKNHASSPPGWYHEVLADAKTLTPFVQLPDVKVEWMQAGNSPDSFFYQFWDEANPWVMPRSIRFKCDSTRAESYVMENYYKAKHLYEGVIHAWLHYQRTGEAVMPAWVPDNSLMGYPNRGGAAVKMYKRAAAL